MRAASEHEAGGHRPEFCKMRDVHSRGKLDVVGFRDPATWVITAVKSTVSELRGRRAQT